MKGYQLSCKAKFKSFSGDRTFFNNKVYVNKEHITEEVIEKFKESCCDGGGMFDLDKSTAVITINELEILE